MLIMNLSQLVLRIVYYYRPARLPGHEELAAAADQEAVRLDDAAVGARQQPHLPREAADAPRQVARHRRDTPPHAADPLEGARSRHGHRR